MSAEARIPLYLLTGFLGSGKTTLLNSVLRLPALANTAVIVNEMGAIGLDQLVIGQASDNVTLLDAGCLCCVNSGALHETLADLLGRRARGEVPPFERVIIETSGAAEPAPLLHILLGHPLVTPDFRLAAVVCTADAQHFLESRKTHPELDKQVAMADRVVITKRDLANPSLVEEFLSDSEVVDAGKAFIGESRPQARLGALGSLQHGRPGSLRAFAFRPARMDWPTWAAWTQRVAPLKLVRVKGLLKMEDTGEILLVQGVQGVFHPPQRFRDWPDADRANRLICIARDVQRSEIEETLKEYA